MIWILGFITVLVAGVLLTNLLLSKDPPQRKTRPPLVWRNAPRVSRRSHAGAGAPSSSPSSDMDTLTLFAASGYGESSPSVESASSDCDTGSGSPGDYGDCGSGGGSVD